MPCRSTMASLRGVTRMVTFIPLYFGFGLFGWIIILWVLGWFNDL